MLRQFSIALMLAVSSAGAAPPGADTGTQAIVPFLGDGVGLVVHLDLIRLGDDATAQKLLRSLSDTDDAAGGSSTVAGWVESLRRVGAKDLYILGDPADLPGPPVAVVPLAEGANARAIGEILCAAGATRPLFAWPTCATIHNAVFAGTPTALDRIRAGANAPRADLASVLAASSDSAAQIVIVPSASQRRILEEMVPSLPSELGGGTTSTVTRRMLWTSLAVAPDSKGAVTIVIQSSDAEAAKALGQFGQDALKVIAPLLSHEPGSAQKLAQLKPDVENDRVVFNMEMEQASALLGGPLRAASGAIHRVDCAKNLQEIAIAMHRHLDAKKTFPPSFSRDTDGRPLLSWRVHLLPYLDQQSLFNEFHLDEGWDSPHNKALIARMPAIYVCPAASRKLAASGKTTYLVPRGKLTVFPPTGSTRIADIRDGTSNTIMVMDVSDTSAVVWTKPDDWDVDSAPSDAGLFGHHRGGTNAATADGAVHFLPRTIAPATLRILFTRDGGEIVNWNDL